MECAASYCYKLKQVFYVCIALHSFVTLLAHVRRMVWYIACCVGVEVAEVGLKLHSW